MITPILVVGQPQFFDYSEFFDLVIPKLSRSATCVEVIVHSHLSNAYELNKVLSFLYPQIRKKLLASDFSHKFGIDIFVNKFPRDLCADSQVFHVHGESLPALTKNLSLESVQVSLSQLSMQIENCVVWPEYQAVNTAAIGGTFDHLHDGHKILLSMATFVAKENIIIGVAGPELLRKKKYSSALQPLDHRINAVMKFLQRMTRPGQRFQIYEFNDICGPTGFISRIDSLIVSQETMNGAEFVNAQRTKDGLKALNIICASVIGDDHDKREGWSFKLSSTTLRKLEIEKNDDIDLRI